jgi:hypothetical protein
MTTQTTSNVPLHGNHCLSLEAKPVSVRSAKLSATVRVNPDAAR